MTFYYENKLMISLWNSSKYSLNVLNTILDIFSSNYPNLSSSLITNNNNNNSEQNLKNIFLIPLQNNFECIIPIIINAKHMGVVRGMSDCLFKISVLLNKSELNMVCKNKMQTQIKEIIQPEKNCQDILQILKINGFQNLKIL